MFIADERHLHNLAVDGIPLSQRHERGKVIIPNETCHFDPRPTRALLSLAPNPPTARSAQRSDPFPPVEMPSDTFIFPTDSFPGGNMFSSAMTYCGCGVGEDPDSLEAASRSMNMSSDVMEDSDWICVLGDREMWLTIR